MIPHPLLTGAFAGVAAVAASAWSWLRSLWDSFLSMFVVRVRMDSQVGNAVVSYCASVYTRLPSRNRSIQSTTEYVRSRGHYMTVAYTTPPLPAVFTKSLWQFLHVQGPAPDSGDNPRHTSDSMTHTISFLRGTFDINELVATALEWDFQHTSTNQGGKRFYVTKHFGSRNRDEESPSAVEKASSTSRYQRTYIGHHADDLGAPTRSEPFECLEYNNNVLAYRQYVHTWFQARDWYKERRIPWRTSALLKGSPGQGKTSFVRALAQELDMPLHVIDTAGMGNPEFSSAYLRAYATAPCIVLLEDFDRVDFSVIETISGTKLTMDCVLNTVAGVEATDGIILFVTANDVSKIDPAMLRPGRLDKHLEFTSPPETAKTRIAERILRDCNVNVAEVVAAGINDSGAEFEFRCQEAALASFWGSEHKLPRDGRTGPGVAMLMSQIRRTNSLREQLEPRKSWNKSAGTKVIS